MSRETKRTRFVRIAEARTNRILDQLRLLGNCSNKNNYEYADEDIKKIFRAIDQEVKNVKAKFDGEDAENKKFTLS